MADILEAYGNTFGTETPLTFDLLTLVQGELKQEQVNEYLYHSYLAHVTVNVPDMISYKYEIYNSSNLTSVYSGELTKAEVIDIEHPNDSTWKSSFTFPVYIGSDYFVKVIPTIKETTLTTERNKTLIREVTNSQILENVSNTRQAANNYHSNDYSGRQDPVVKKGLFTDFELFNKLSSPKTFESSPIFSIFYSKKELLLRKTRDSLVKKNRKDKKVELHALHEKLDQETDETSLSDKMAQKSVEMVHKSVSKESVYQGKRYFTKENQTKEMSVKEAEDLFKSEQEDMKPVPLTGTDSDTALDALLRSRDTMLNQVHKRRDELR